LDRRVEVKRSPQRPSQDSGSDGVKSYYAGVIGPLSTPQTDARLRLFRQPNSRPTDGARRKAGSSQHRRAANVCRTTPSTLTAHLPGGDEMNHRVLFPQTGRNMKPERSRPLTVPFVGADRAAQFCGPRRLAGRLDRKPPARLASDLGAARLTRDARLRDGSCCRFRMAERGDHRCHSGTHPKGVVTLNNHKEKSVRIDVLKPQQILFRVQSYLVTKI
jgi:hypothetical protein